MKTFLSVLIVLWFVAAYFINEDTSEKYEQCLEHNRTAILDSSIEVKNCSAILE